LPRIIDTFLLAEQQQRRIAAQASGRFLTVRTRFVFDNFHFSDELAPHRSMQQCHLANGAIARRRSV
jgi:hypothetical protein